MQAETIQSPCSRPTREYDVDRLSIFRKFLGPLDLESQAGQQKEASEDIRIDSIHSNGAETNQTNTNIARPFLRLTSLDRQRRTEAGPEKTWAGSTALELRSRLD